MKSWVRFFIIQPGKTLSRIRRQSIVLQDDEAAAAVAALRSANGKLEVCDDGIMIADVAVIPVMMKGPFVKHPPALQVIPVPLLLGFELENVHVGGLGGLEVVGPGGDVVEVPLLVDGGLGLIGVGSRQPVRRRWESAKVVGKEVEDKVIVENRMLFLKQWREKVRRLETRYNDKPTEE